MNHHFNKPFRKQLLIGLLLILVSVALGILLGGRFLGPDSLMLHRFIYILCVIGPGLGGLTFIFLGWRGLVLSLCFVLVLTLPRVLPDPWNRYFSFLYLAGLFGLPPLLNRRKKKKSGTSPKSGKGRRVMLQHLRTGLFVALGAIDLPWLFLDVPYKLFSVLSLLPFLAVLLIIGLFPEDVTLDDRKYSKAGGRVDLITPLTLSGIAPALRTIMDFNFLTWKPLLIQAGILLALIGIVLFLFSWELRQRFWYFLCVLLLCAMFSLGAIGQLNYLLDTSVSQQQSATITDMHISTGSKSPDRYILTLVTLSGTEMELQTSKEHYNELSVGDTVTVYIRQGGLGIPYAIAD